MEGNCYIANRLIFYFP